jgi:hypothetical protein
MKNTLTIDVFENADTLTIYVSLSFFCNKRKKTFYVHPDVVETNGD